MIIKVGNKCFQQPHNTTTNREATWSWVHHLEIPTNKIILRRFPVRPWYSSDNQDRRFKVLSETWAWNSQTSVLWAAINNLL